MLPHWPWGGKTGTLSIYKIFSITQLIIKVFQSLNTLIAQIGVEREQRLNLGTRYARGCTHSLQPQGDFFFLS